MKRCLAAALLLGAGLAVHPTLAQDGSFIFGGGGEQLVGEGWEGFTNVAFLLHSVLILTAAAALGAAIAFHPRSRRVVDTVEEAEAPKTYVTYAVVGAVIGLMVVEFGLVVGFVVFGIGGLIRFRTALPSATKTGRLIFVTLIGLSAGLNLPHLAVLATAFLYGLIYALDARITFSIEIQGIDDDRVLEASEAHRAVLQEHGCKIVSEKRSLSKGKIAYVFQSPHDTTRGELERAFEAAIPHRLRGTLDWEMA